MIADYVEAERTIADLRRETKGGTIATRMAATRALNVATAERRRLHQRLFAGGRRPEEVPPTIEAVAAVTINDADQAWRLHYHAVVLGIRPQLRSHVSAAEDRRIAEWKREGEALEAKFGPPSWPALLYPTVEAEIEADRALEAYRHRHRVPRRERSVSEAGQ